MPQSLSSFKLDAVSSRVILVKMSIDPNHCFFACVKAGFERRPVFSPAIPVVVAAPGRRFVTDPIEQ